MNCMLLPAPLPRLQQVMSCLLKAADGIQWKKMLLKNRFVALSAVLLLLLLLALLMLSHVESDSILFSFANCNARQTLNSEFRSSKLLSPAAARLPTCKQSPFSLTRYCWPCASNKIAFLCHRDCGDLIALFPAASLTQTLLFSKLRQCSIPSSSSSSTQWVCGVAFC
jgi:hypothetical protein